MDAFVERNLALMRSTDSGGMMRLLNSESMGGNAQSFRNRPCVGANFCYSPQTGEILWFANPQNVPPALRAKGEIGLFRLVFDFFKGQGSGKLAILEVFDVPAGVARRVIDESVARYNELFGFPLSSLEQAA